MIGKTLAKNLIGTVGASQPLKPIMRHLLRTRANVAYYHFVGKTDPFFKEFSGNCSLQRFEQDLLRLKSYFELVPLQTVLDINSCGATPDHPMLAVTFDDGFNLVRGGAMEVLDRHNVKATAFLITACIDNQNMMWRNKISAMMNSVPADTLLKAYNESIGVSEGFCVTNVQQILEASMLWPMRQKETLVDTLWAASGMVPLSEYLADFQPYMTWEDLNEWRSHGHQIGLHTRTHPVCANLEADIIVDEIVRPAEFLKKRL